jgi:glutathione S-transferase
LSVLLHYFPTPNGHKVAIALEEMALPYDVVIVNILEAGQDDPAFRAINPNGRIPALVDEDVAVFESGAILQYLGRKSGQFYPADEPGRAQVDSWLFWQMAGAWPDVGAGELDDPRGAKAGAGPVGDWPRTLPLSFGITSAVRGS